MTKAALAALAALACSCDNPRTAALRELADRGVEPSAVALTAAAAEGRIDVLGLLLDAGVFPDAPDRHGRTPLAAAVERGDLAVVFRLLDGGADPDTTLPDGSSTLSLAVARGEEAVVHRLLEAGAWPGGRMPGGDPLLSWAIHRGRLPVVERLLDHAGFDPNQRDPTGRPLVHIALAGDRPGILDALLERGADPSARDPAGVPLVHAALTLGDIERVGQLLDLGIDPATTDGHGRSLLAAAVEGRHRQLAERLLGSDPGPVACSTLDSAIRNGWTDLLPALVAHGADPNRPAAGGRTLLEAALATGDARGAGVLARLGASPGPGGWGPRLWQLYRGNRLPLIAELLAAGIPPDARDERGRTIVERAFADGSPAAACLFLRFGAPPGDAVYQACLRGDTEALQLLLEHRCPATPCRAPWLDTPLAAATRNGDTGAVRLLLDHGAPPESPGAEGQRPLAVAALLGHGDIVGLLLDHGADPERELAQPVRREFLAHADRTLRWTLEHDRRIRPLMLAAHSGSVDALRHLLDHGAARNSYTLRNKRYPINFASRRGHVAAMQVLLGRRPGSAERRIVVDLSDQFARVFDSDDREIFSTRVSTGRSGYRTPTGEFVITNKHRDWTSTIYHASMPYFQRLSCGSFGFHQGYVPSYPASHGCIRVPSGNASRLFKLTELGDRVVIVE